MQHSKSDLTRELERVESEVRGLSRRQLRSRAEGARLVALAAREYEILEAMSRPWRRSGGDVVDRIPEQRRG